MLSPLNAARWDRTAAAPLFVAGPKLRANLVGSLPRLAPEDLERGDLRFKIDFRSVCAAVLEPWLGVDSQPVLGRLFHPIPLFQLAPFRLQCRPGLA